ncbi:Uncharacterised protein [Acinetobacter baumannii]|nr:Uncharacterised protein [Acinetobacter baumannii]
MRQAMVATSTTFNEMIFTTTPWRSNNGCGATPCTSQHSPTGDISHVDFLNIAQTKLMQKVKINRNYYMCIHSESYR